MHAVKVHLRSTSDHERRAAANMGHAPHACMLRRHMTPIFHGGSALGRSPLPVLGIRLKHLEMVLIYPSCFTHSRGPCLGSVLLPYVITALTMSRGSW